jgi:baculoviral IAP repeat-containing protein 6
MIVLLRRMVDCELTVECLIQQRWEKSKSCGLEEWMWGDGEITWEMKKDKNGHSSDFARDPPLYENFRRLNKQCEAFLTGVSQMMNGEDGDDDHMEEMVQATSLCGDITAARDDIERTMVALGRHSLSDCSGSNGRPEELTEAVLPKNKDKGKGRDPAVDMEKTYSMECERLAFRHVDTLSDDGRNGFGLDYANYNYVGQLNQTGSATRNPKDRLHLIKELAVMATCLPPGVWVRVDEVRHDAM